MSLRPLPVRANPLWVALLLVCTLLVCTGQTATSRTIAMSRGTVGNPLVGTWGVYRGAGDQAWVPYTRATGTKRELLGHIALAPKARWFGAWIPTRRIAATLNDYIVRSQNGDPDAWVQLTIFRMDPWNGAAKKKVPSKQQIADYKKWIRVSARAIGDTRTILVLQPDSTTLRSVPKPRLSARLIRYAAKRYGALPNTRLYLETGGWDWPHPGQGGAPEAARLLSASGIEFADGIATNTTHYNSTERDIERIAELAQIFAKRGLALRGVVNTSSNGNPFEFGKYRGKDPDNAVVCKPGRLSGTCVTLGIPPTTDVANPAWGLSARHRALAAQYVDAYLWIGRPWLYRQADPFRTKRALKLVRSSPWYRPST